MKKQNIGRSEPGKLKYAIVLLIPLALIAFFAIHELSVRYVQDKTCTVCHEMKEPIRKWKESGAAANHHNCAGCHYDSSIAGWWEMNLSSIKFLVVHFNRDPDEPIQPRQEPLFLEEGKEPGYWTRVPNHRCYQCHDAKNHAKEDQERIHDKAVKDVLSKPCIDCHSHEMRKGQKFYEKILATQEPAARTGDPM